MILSAELFQRFRDVSFQLPARFFSTIFRAGVPCGLLAG